MTKAELLKRVRAKCLDCCCGSSKEVEKCVIPDCTLYEVRFGKDPTRRVLSTEQRANLAQRLSLSRKMKTLTHTREKKSKPEG